MLFIISIGCFLLLSAVHAEDAQRVVRVSGGDAFREAVQNATPGTRILLAPGDYPGGMNFRNVQGTAERPILIAGEESEKPPVFLGRMQFSDPAYLELRDLVLRGSATNGLNVDDGGSYETPAHHVTLRRLHVLEVGPTGNRDGIKLSGLDDFQVFDCRIERWGTDGSAIDMVGCHRGLIERCVMRHMPEAEGSGVQAKGGSTDIQIRRNRFEQAGSRPVNIGGSTGFEYFRPSVDLNRTEPPANSEAARITVEGNTFIGSACAVAFVGVDGAVVRYNTIARPSRWAIRILQETRHASFVPSRNGVFEHNLVVFDAPLSEGGVNIGSGTAPESFRFAGNWWHCIETPENSRPTLPAPETDGTYGVNPLLEGGAFRLRKGSPVKDAGADWFDRRG